MIRVTRHFDLGSSSRGSRGQSVQCLRHHAQAPSRSEERAKQGLVACDQRVRHGWRTPACSNAGTALRRKFCQSHGLFGDTPHPFGAALKGVRRRCTAPSQRSEIRFELGPHHRPEWTGCA